MTSTLDIGTAQFDAKADVSSQAGAVLDPDQARVLSHISDAPNGNKEISFFVPSMMCGGCMKKIEAALTSVAGVQSARANLSARRVTVVWAGAERIALTLLDRLSNVGFEAMPYAVDSIESVDANKDRQFLRALAVAGFGAANIMLLSVAVWSGVGGDMEHETRQLFHWVSALIAVPVVAFSGRPFFTSALTALRAQRMNMDVPISLAIILAIASSLGQLIAGGEHAYFDAAVTLLFFLLIGRYLDQHMRRRAGSAVKDLLALKSETTIRLCADGTAETVSSDDLRAGDHIFVPAGFVISADGRVVEGRSDLDVSVMTGESLPASVGPASEVFAGTTNLSSNLTIEVTARSDASMLAEITRLMEVAEQGQGAYRKISDKVAAFYAPAVHIVAGLTVVAWVLLGLSWPQALMIGVSVLIITCPCAVALAIPVVNIVAVGRLFRDGILCKSEDALERMSQITSVIFDKTGTLTEGRLSLKDDVNERDLCIAASLAQSSHHPLSRALVDAARNRGLQLLAVNVHESPGLGLETQIDGRTVRLGSARFVGAADPDADRKAEVFLKQEGHPAVRFVFEEVLRPGAEETCDALRAQHMDITLLSGDNDGPAQSAAGLIGADTCVSRATPIEKSAYVRDVTGSGARPLYVGDGINDGPAAQAAFVAMSPADGARLSQNVADFVFQKNDLSAITETLTVSRSAQRLVRQNLMLAFAYNAIAIPLSVMGFATPLVAAIAMSSSSLLVTLNALRLHENAPALLRG